MGRSPWVAMRGMASRSGGRNADATCPGNSLLPEKAAFLGRYGERRSRGGRTARTASPPTRGTGGSEAIRPAAEGRRADIIDEVDPPLGAERRPSDKGREASEAMPTGGVSGGKAP